MLSHTKCYAPVTPRASGSDERASRGWWFVFVVATRDARSEADTLRVYIYIYMTYGARTNDQLSRAHTAPVCRACENDHRWAGVVEVHTHAHVRACMCVTIAVVAFAANTFAGLCADMRVSSGALLYCTPVREA